MAERNFATFFRKSQIQSFFLIKDVEKEIIYKNFKT
jgi:hypothetical protein